MAFTLVVNPGSSSKKYALYSGVAPLLTAYIERKDNGFEMCTSVRGTQQKCESLPVHDYQTSLRNFFELAIAEQIISSLTEIKRVAIRVVAPGTYFQTHQKIDELFITKLKKCADLAPLHIPHIQKEIMSLRQAVPQAVFVAVSDSAFHTTMPKWVREYSLPKADSADLDLYRFGYHGLSVASVLRRFHSVVGVDSKRVVVCHIGSGVSVTATEAGKSVDTTMGFAPGSGLIMGSRAGDVDAGALLTLMKRKNLKPIDAEMYLQTKGGLKGLSSEADLRFILERKAKGDKSADQAITSFVYQIKKAIGGYVATLGGVDALVFTATAGERSPALRYLIVKSMEALGVKLDDDKNLACVSRDGVISDISSQVKVVVIRTDEANEILFASLEVE